MSSKKQGSQEIASKRLKLDENAEQQVEYQVVFHFRNLQAMISVDQHNELGSMKKLFTEKRENERRLIINLSMEYDNLDIKRIITACGEAMKKNLSGSNCVLFFQACKKYGTTIASNEIFHWILIHFMSLSSSKLSDDELNIIDKDLLLNLLKHESFVVTSEISLYEFLKKWMRRDLARKGYQGLNTKSFCLTKEMSEPYQDIFMNLRLNSLLSCPDKVHQIFEDRIISSEVLFQVLFKMYTPLISNNKLLAQDDKNKFRFAKRISSSRDVEITTGFFFHGVALKYRFNSNRVSIERLGAMNLRSKCLLMNYDHISVRTLVTLYGPAKNGRCISEESPLTAIDLYIERERLIHNWRKPVAFPSIIFVELHISCGSDVVDISQN